MCVYMCVCVSVCVCVCVTMSARVHMVQNVCPGGCVITKGP